MSILSIDPGSAESAYALIIGNRGDDPFQIIDAGKVSNEAMITLINMDEWGLGRMDVVVEGIQSYGMPVGREVFDTCYMVGRLLQLCDMLGHPNTVYNRPEYSKAICGTNKVTDAILRQSLRLRFGDDTKKTDPLYPLRGNSDKRSAYALAVYHYDRCYFKAKDSA